MTRKKSYLNHQRTNDVLYNLNHRTSRMERKKESLEDFNCIKTDCEDHIQSTGIPSWEEIYSEAIKATGSGHRLTELLSDSDIESSNEQLRNLHREYNQIHKLDRTDLAISIAGGLVAALIDIFLVGIPEKTYEGLKESPLGNHVRKWFVEKYDSEELARLAQSKVPYDAPYNAGYTSIDVDGLNTYMHRLYSLGHDPILGLVIGVLDVMSGKMTTIDKQGNFVSQVMDGHDYQNRIEVQAFDALAKVILHFKSDLNTAMGLPAPLMGIFNLCQFGNITDENLAVAEIVQGMYFEGFDFVHFCSQSISVMVEEVLVRILYALKRINEGNALKDSIPLTTNHQNNPKLGTMLFIAHTSATAINAGKIYFAYKNSEVTHSNPFVSINYPQWVAFAVYSFKQAKWLLLDKPGKRDEYTMGKLYEDFENALKDDKNFISKGYTES